MQTTEWTMTMKRNANMVRIRPAIAFFALISLESYIMSGAASHICADEKAAESTAASDDAVPSWLVKHRAAAEAAFEPIDGGISIIATIPDLRITDKQIEQLTAAEKKHFDHVTTACRKIMEARRLDLNDRAAARRIIDEYRPEGNHFASKLLSSILSPQQMQGLKLELLNTTGLKCLFIERINEQIFVARDQLHELAAVIEKYESTDDDTVRKGPILLSASQSFYLDAWNIFSPQQIVRLEKVGLRKPPGIRTIEWMPVTDLIAGGEKVSLLLKPAGDSSSKVAKPTEYNVIVIRALAPVNEQAKAFEKGFSVPGRYLKFKDLEVQRKESINGKDWSDWLQVSLSSMADVLSRSPEFSPETLDVTLVNSVVTSPLPLLADGDWGRLALHDKSVPKSGVNVVRIPDFSVRPGTLYLYRIRIAYRSLQPSLNVEQVEQSAWPQEKWTAWAAQSVPVSIPVNR
jgi:hypothetical protein